MIEKRQVQKLAELCQTTTDNVLREYFQHLFLLYLYQEKDSENLLFKGGTALRIIWKSEVFGAPPIVIPKRLEKSIKEKLSDIFLSMSEDTQGQKILDALDVEYFRKPRAGEYDSAYKIWKNR